MLNKIRLILIAMFLFCCSSIINGQTDADLKKIIKSEKDATQYQNEINRLKKILVQSFLTKANNKKEKAHKQIQDFFADYKLSDRNLDQYNYPELLDKTNLTISITGYDNTWGLLPKDGNTSLLEGSIGKTLNAIVTIPVFESYHRGESLNSITFFCTLTETINWTEKEDNKLPREKLPSYNKHIEIEIKQLDLDK